MKYGFVPGAQNSGLAFADGKHWLYRSVTATARATIDLLQLNSEPRCEIRSWLTIVERHPPS
jgi:hypothetical protein